MFEVQQFFKRHFGYAPPKAVSVPGRVELLGHHQEPNEGLALTLTVNRQLAIAFGPRTDGRVELASASTGDAELFSISNLDPNPIRPWTDYVKAVLRALRRHDASFPGFNAAIHSTIPMGAGLGSSSALTVASALMIRELQPYRLTETGTLTPPRRDRRGDLPELSRMERMIMARLCGAAEAEVAGSLPSLHGPVSALCGREYSALEFDFQHHNVELHPMIGDFLMVLCDTGVRADPRNEQRNYLRMHCDFAARRLGVRVLRAVEPGCLAANRYKLKLREQQCAYHVVGEIQRVIHGGRCLVDGDVEQFGQFVLQSHESARDFMKCSWPEADLLVQIATQLDGCYGARMTGPGFGGATLSLVRSDNVEVFVRELASRYHAQTGQTIQPLICRSVRGVA